VAFLLHHLLTDNASSENIINKILLYSINRFLQSQWQSNLIYDANFSIVIWKLQITFKFCFFPHIYEVVSHKCYNVFIVLKSYLLIRIYRQSFYNYYY